RSICPYKSPVGSRPPGGERSTDPGACGGVALSSRCVAVSRHRFRIQQAIQLLTGEQPFLSHDVVHATTRVQRLFRDLRRALVADCRNQGGDHPYGMLDEIAQSRRVCGNSLTAALAQYDARVSHLADGGEQTERNDRLEDVELKL